ncbi:hypothetical protein [Moritella sp. F3]|uniref:hypothetical protein n=1 Tax=Moritella sp. F3 TaxID=2718882 RepID=UPI0018E0E300|nr:hypothetical protein [Moritella sp. F3]GIC77720.1 hypothetical protein FMO001_24470 [Moritella sp. F1]GIC82133.1 hypothetical protein FMO003_24140 [Moritella sp. F3]
MTSHDIKTNQEFLFPDQVEDAKILGTYPGAKKLLGYIIENKKIAVGTMVVNHHHIPPMVISREMLEHNFPSMRDATIWYVLPESLQPYLFIKSLNVSGKKLELCEPAGRLQVIFNPDTGHVTVSGKTSDRSEAYSFTFHEFEKLYQWLNIAKELNTCIYSSLKPFNIVFETDTGKIVGIYDTPTLCDEEAAEQFRRTQRDLSYGIVHTPMGMYKDDVIGKNMSSFAY